MRKSGFNEPLAFTPKTNGSDNTKKKQHIPKSNMLSKIFEKKTVNVSYNYIKNISSITSSHNKTLLRP